MVHRTFKSAVSRTNGKMIERDLIKKYNTLQALRNIIDGTGPRTILIQLTFEFA